ncbi:hypothetical protein AADZ91_16860 [Colwelliaceae bacterium 6441]
MIFQRQQLFGSWYRSHLLADGSVETELAQMTEEGEYEFAFSVNNKQGQLIQQSIELGDWGLVGDIHFTIAKAEYIDKKQFSADLTHPDNYQAYKVIELSHEIFKYQHILSNEVFILKRVIDKIAHC